MEPLKPNDPSQLGDWSITGRLGEGEDSVIYLGVRGVAGSEQAAIKLIEDKTFEFESALEKIKNEVEALKRLDDENIVKLIDAKYEPGNLWIATEYIHGVTLDTKLKQTKKPLDERYWFEVAENIFHALKASHAKGIIHKDIKPSNIILSQSGAKLIDFGISHVPEKTRHATPGDFEGSRLFSAPENYNRKNIEEMDVFSAGVTLAYAAKLKSVWAGDNQDAITESIKNDSPDLSGMTQLQEDFIRPLLEKLPIDRPSSETAHKKALEYIEYLVDKEHRSKPVALRVKRSLARQPRKSWILIGIAVSLITLTLLMITTSSNPKETKTKPITKASDTSPSPSQNSSAPAIPTSSSPALPTPSSPAIPTPSKALPTTESSIRNQNEEKCNSALNANLLDEAIALCLKAVSEKDARGTFLLGTVYVYKDDKVNAAKYLKMAAELGYGRAYGPLGVLYEISFKDIPLAEKYYKKGLSFEIAENYVVYALYLRDRKKNYPEAEKYLLKADKAGLTWGTAELGMLYATTGKVLLAKKYLLEAASVGDRSAMFNYAELLRNEFDDLESACTWYTSSSKSLLNGPENTKSLNLAKSALVNYCQSGLTGRPVLSENVVTYTQPSRPFNSEALRWIIAKESIDADFNYVQFKQVGGKVDWNGISFKEYPSGNDKPWIEVYFNSAASGLCFDFRLVKVEQAKVTKIWNLLPSNCYSFENGKGTLIER